MASDHKSVTIAAIRAQVGAAYDRFDAAEQARHVELLRGIRQPQDVAVHAEATGELQWRVTVSLCDRVGVLSIIAGLFAANRIDIVSGDVFTLRLDESRPPDAHRAARPVPRGARRPDARHKAEPSQKTTRKILDIFDVRTPHSVDARFWQSFRDDLATLVALLASQDLDAARQRVIDRISDSARSERGSDPRLFPVTVELDNDSSATLTELRIHSTDSLGFLFEFTNALAMLNVNVERVEIRTVDHDVRDTFWVTDATGEKITAGDRLHELRLAAVLIKQFTHLLPRSPNPAQALRQFGALASQMLSRADWDVHSLESGAVLRTLADLMGVSQFLWEDFLRMQHENLFPVIRDVPALAHSKTRDTLARELADELADVADHNERVTRLNGFKDREMFRIDLRHITRRIGFIEFAAELSDLAEVVVEQAAEMCQRKLAARFGAPVLPDQRACGWCACALGKFGGRELGFASDVELLFVYEHEGECSGPEPSSNSRYFEELVSEFLRTLIARREGIFEVDLRLRPYGKAGSLACSVDGFTQYFSESGPAEQFERMALVKLRPVAGDRALGARIVEARDAFVYSGRPVDLKNVVHLRGRQATELVPPGQISAKHSPGGLVDVEYFVQVKQIEAGCRDPSVRVTNTLDAIERLRAGGYLSDELARKLRDTYAFLRRLIDALRAVRGHAKDLKIPPADSREFAYLARRLDYDSVGRLQSEMNLRREFAMSLWKVEEAKV